MSLPPASLTPPLPRKRRRRMLRQLIQALRGHRYSGTRPALCAENLPPMQGRIEIVRDRHGVPHIYAEHEPDAYAALGYLQGADRFFILDVLRHLGSGRMCELVGNLGFPGGGRRGRRRSDHGDELFVGKRVSDLDAFVVPLDFEAASQRDFDAMEGVARDCVQGFSDGINAALHAMRGAYPAEYLFLSKLRPWSPSDCLLAARTSGFVVSLMPLENELTFDAVRGHVGDEAAKRIYPDVPWENVPKIDRHGEGTLPEAPIHLPSGGSNNWAVSAERSASGAPVLANDPHVPLIPLPTYWYHCHIETPAYRVQGGCFPGYPAFGYGHNGHLAWGCTTAMRDAWDLIRVHRLPGDATRYRTATGSGEISRHRAKRRTRLGRELVLEWESCEHGVIYPDWKHDDGADLAVRFVPSDAGRYLAGYRQLAASKSVDDHRAALREMNEGPFDFNHVYAHKDGHIGWEVFGRLPRRECDGLFARDAHDPSAQWNGYLDFDEMPKRLNPHEGYVASANSHTCAEQSHRVATHAHYEPRLRQDRIEKHLAASQGHSVDSFTSIQSDVDCDYARPQRDALVALLEPICPSDGREARALSTLRDWDGRFGIESVAAGIFFFTLKELSTRCFAAVLGKRLGRRYSEGRNARPRLAALLLDAEDLLRGDIERAGKSLAELGLESLGAALDRMRSICGPESSWSWGRVQRARLGTVLAEMPRFGEKLLALDAAFPGDDYTVNPSRSLDEKHRLRAFVAATSRFVCDLSKPEEAWFAHSSGPSGDPGSAYYANLSESWSRFEYFRSALWSADAIPHPAERLVIEKKN